MELFGKKQNVGDKVKKQKVKSPAKKKNKKRKYTVPADVKLFLRMPIILLIGIALVCIGNGWILWNNHQYNQRVLESSMSYGQQLPLYAGTSKGVLSLGETLLSKDGKTLAVEIIYDDDAHRNMSSFGDRYRIRLVDTDDNRMSVKMEYGLFGTDGSGVLTIHSKEGFSDKAFMVMIIDNGQLVTSSDLQSSSIMSDAELDKSITAQLSGNVDANTSELQEEKRNLPPLYSIRLNAANATKDTVNWENDKEIVENLFVKKSIENKRNEQEEIRKKIKKGETTLEEMKKRIEQNPQDDVAASNVQQLENSLNSLSDQMTVLDQNIELIESKVFEEDILSPKQTKSEKYTVPDLSYVR